MLFHSVLWLLLLWNCCCLIGFPVGFGVRFHGEFLQRLN
jgi:hypothetical protein